MIARHKILTLGGTIIIVFMSWYIISNQQKQFPTATWNVHSLGLKMVTPSQIFTWRTPPVINSLADFFKPKTHLTDISVGTRARFPDGEILRLSNHTWRIKTRTSTWLIFDKAITHAELQLIITLPVSYQTDYWLLSSQAEAVASMFPVPRKGVLVMNSKKPTKFWKTWSQKNQRAVIPVALFGEKNVTIIDQ
jgi:hypothetical protein